MASRWFGDEWVDGGSGEVPNHNNVTVAMVIGEQMERKYDFSQYVGGTGYFWFKTKHVRDITKACRRVCIERKQDLKTSQWIGRLLSKGPQEVNTCRMQSELLIILYSNLLLQMREVRLDDGI